MESKYKKVLLGLGVAIALVIGIGATVPEQQPTPLASSSPTEVEVGNVGDGQGPGNGNMPDSTELSDCVEADDAYALMNQAQSEMEAGYSAAQNYQLDAAARHLNTAGTLYIDATQYVHDTPEISEPMMKSGQMMIESSTQLELGNINASTNLLVKAITQVKTITSATKAYGVAC
jgi:hypothetical protein